MAADLTRVTWFMYDPNSGNGWSETLWNTLTDMDTLRQWAGAYALKRFPLLGYLAKVTFARIQQWDSSLNRAVASQLIAGGNLWVQTNASTSDGKQSNNPDLDPACLIVVLKDALFTKKKLIFLRGIPDRIVSNPPGMIDPFGDADFQNAWAAFKTHMKSYAWGWMARVVPAAKIFATNAITVTAGVPPAPNIMTVTTAVPHTFANGDTVRFRGGKTTPRLKGTYPIFNVAGSSMQMIVNTSQAPTIKKFPNVESVTYAMVPCGVIQATGYATHRTGRPFGLSRGRRKRAPLTV